MAIYEVRDTHLLALTPTTFGAHAIREREDLQRLLRQNIEIISPDTLVIAEEFGRWDASRRRIDLLGIDKDANIVVIELKRTVDGGHMELQAIRYAAMVSTMTFAQVVDVFSGYLKSIGQERDSEEILLEFLGWDEPDEDSFAQDVRIVLASAEFSKELTTSVMWLNERQLDIRCVRLKPYTRGETVLLDVQQVVPLPEAADYQVQVAEKQQRERRARSSDKSSSIQIMNLAEQHVCEHETPGFMQRLGTRLYFLPADWDELLPRVGGSWSNKLERPCPIVWWFKYSPSREQIGFVLEIGSMPNLEFRRRLIQDIQQAGFSINKLAHREESRFTRAHTVWKKLQHPLAASPSDAMLRAEIAEIWDEFVPGAGRIRELVWARDWAEVSAIPN